MPLAWTLLRKLARCWTLSGDHAIDCSLSNKYVCSLALWHHTLLSISSDVGKTRYLQACAGIPCLVSIPFLVLCRVGTLSTIASDGAASGFPSGSVVEYAPDEKGRPIFMLSSISPHTKHLRQDSRCSFTVLAPAFRVRAHDLMHLFHHFVNA